MKRMIGLCLTGVLLCSLAACAPQNSGKADLTASTTDSLSSETQPAATTEALHTLYIRAPKEVTAMTATFLNTASGKTADIEMKKSSEDTGSITFCCEADVNQYNMVHVTYGKETSEDVAFNRFVSGWNLEEKQLRPYTVGKQPSYDPQLETKTFSFDGRDKTVYIWTPEDYDEKSAEKYSVVYLFDGQSVLTTGKEQGMDNDVVCWNVSEHTESMMAETDHQAIIVAIENNDVYRSDELVPDLGEINTEDEYEQINTDDFTKKRGSAFADFLCDTVMPYIEKTYHVYTDAAHTSLAGASLGGLETFYTVLSHPDKFGAGGVMSATFDMYAEKEWNAFLADKMKSENAPLLYFYAGSYAADNGDVTETMYNQLLENGYPKDKLVFSKYESGEHLIDYWKNIFPEFLEAAFSRSVSALPFGVPVHYQDKRDPLEEYLEDMEFDINEIKPGYVYYDNSETKWEKVYAYWWGGMAFNTVTKEPYYFAEWPGFEMEQIEGTDIYRVVAPWGINGGIIFDSGVTDREVAEGKEAYQTVDLQYSTDMIGKIYHIDMSVEPKADPGNMKTKHRYPAGSWSDYVPQK